jgi:alcohol dehydrogenase class IV
MNPPIGNFNYPTAYRIGCGRRRELAAACVELELLRPLVVTDPGVAGLAWFGELVEGLRGAGLGVEVWSAVQANPTGSDVAAGIAAYRAGEHDGIVLVGGGSAMDAGKSVALVVNNPGEVFDYEDVGDNWKRADPERIPRMIALPTTAGTGSEVGRAAVVTDPADHTKKIIFHPLMLPKVVIADPELTLDLPAKITAWTGMDALSHSLEAWCSPFFHPLGEGIALEAMRLVKEWLPVAVEEGKRIEGRAFMLAASSMGAIAFQKGLGAMHAMSHPCSSLRGTHHGLTNAVVMPYVLEHNRFAVDGRLAALARYLDLPAHSPQAVIEWVLRLRERIGIPNTLAEIGVKDDVLPEAARMAEIDPSNDGNPVPMKAKDYEGLYRKAITGVL